MLTNQTGHLLIKKQKIEKSIAKKRKQIYTISLIEIINNLAFPDTTAKSIDILDIKNAKKMKSVPQTYRFHATFSRELV